MAKTVADLMAKDVLTVEPSDTIGEAAEKMHAGNVGAVVVVMPVPVTVPPGLRCAKTVVAKAIAVILN